MESTTLDKETLSLMMKERHPRLHAAWMHGPYIIIAWAFAAIVTCLCFGGFADIGQDTLAAYSKTMLLTIGLLALFPYYAASCARDKIKREWRDEHTPWLSQRSVKAFMLQHVPKVRMWAKWYMIFSMCFGVAALSVHLALLIWSELTGLDYTTSPVILAAFVVFLVLVFSSCIVSDLLTDYTRRMITLLREKEAL